MGQLINLQIPTPCHENWEAMTASEKGRFCASCQKQVVDFTLLSDAQVAQFFQTSSGETCGRFNNSQLNRDFLVPRKPVPYLKYLFTIALPAFLVSLKASAQVAPVKTEQVGAEANSETRTLGRIATSPAGAVSGRVTDAEGRPLPYVSIMVHGTQQGTMSDSSGRFVLSKVSFPVTLNFTSVGYDVVPKTVLRSDSSLKVQMNAQSMGMVVTAGAVVVTRRKRPKRAEAKKTVCAIPTPAMSVYPNPSSGAGPLNIRWSNLEKGAYTLVAYTFNGVAVKSEKLSVTQAESQTSLELSNVPAGNYILVLKNEKTGKALQQQVVVAR